MTTKHTEAYDFLNSHTAAVLSTLSSKAEPWGSAIYYVVDKDFNFYFLTHMKSKKYKNMLQQPKAAMTVFDDALQITVQAYGTISEVPIGEENNTAFRKLAEIHPPGEYVWTPPVSKLHDGIIQLLKFTPSVLQYADFKAGSKAEQII